MKSKLLKKIAICSLVSLGTVATGVSLTSCGGSSNGTITFTIGEETGTSFTKASGSIFTIEAAFSAVEGFEFEGVESWQWAVNTIDGLVISGGDTSALTVETTMAHEYVFTATYLLGEVEVATGTVTVNVIDAETTYRLRIDESASTLTYNQGTTFNKDNIVVYREGIQLGEVAFETRISDYDIVATIGGSNVTLTDSYQLTVVGTFDVTISYDGLTASTSISVLEDVAWQFSSTLGEYLSNDDYYIYSGYTGTEIAVKDDVLVDYGSSTAYYVTDGPFTLSDLDGQSATNAVRKFDIEISSYDIESATANEFVLSVDYVYSSNSLSYYTYSDIADVAYMNGYYLASSAWTDSLTNGISEGSSSYWSDVSGYVLGSSLLEYFIKISDSSGVMNNYTVLEGVLMETGYEGYYVIYVTVYSSYYGVQYFPIYLGLGWLYDSEVEVVKTAAESSTESQASGYEDTYLENRLAVTELEEGEYMYEDMYSAYYEEINRTTVNQRYTYVEDNVIYEGQTWGFVVDDAESNVWDGTSSLYFYDEVEGVTLSDSSYYQNVNIGIYILSYVYLGINRIFDGADSELLWTQFDTEYYYTTQDSQGNDITDGPGYKISVYRALGSGFPALNVYSTIYHGIAYSTAMLTYYGVYGIYTEMWVYEYYESNVGEGDGEIEYTAIVPYFNMMDTGATYESRYPGKIYFSDLSYYLYEGDAYGEVEAMETYLDGNDNGGGEGGEAGGGNGGESNQQVVGQDQQVEPTAASVVTDLYTDKSPYNVAAATTKATLK